jgi:hypothetical protein
MTTTNSVNDIRNKRPPEEVAVDRRDSLLVAEVAERFMDMVDEDAAKASETTARMNGYPDVRYAETKATVGAILVEETGRRVDVVNRVRVDDGESLLEQWVSLVAVLDRFRVLVDGNGGKFCVWLVGKIR